MGAKELANETVNVVPAKIRWLCLLAGTVSGIAGMLLFGAMFWVFPFFLISGAVIQPYLKRTGRWFLLIGAFILSLYAFLFIGPQAVGDLKMLIKVHDINVVMIIALSQASIILVVWCDVALVLDTRRQRHLRTAS